jgi:hypothetical protein
MAFKCTSCPIVQDIRLILATLWWWQELGRDWQRLNAQNKFLRKRLNLKKLNEVEGK